MSGDVARYVLGRFTFGERPGDRARVTGQFESAEAWFDAQLVLGNKPEPPHVYPEVWNPYTTLLAAYRNQKSGRLGKPADRFQEQRVKNQKANGQKARRALNKVLDNGRLVSELQAEIIAGQLASEAQLREVMTDFWLAHFNVYVRKGLVKFYAPNFVQTVRSHALGDFETLLHAVTTHPAMLVYLDNQRSVSEAFGEKIRKRALSSINDNGNLKPARPKPRGLNENLARELLELHTLGVDAGYSQTDVRETARILTGFSLAPYRRGEFGMQFFPNRHDKRPKSVLGWRFDGGRDGAGELTSLLHRLATHPKTRARLAFKLCQRFESDRPTAYCQQALVKAGQGARDIENMLRTLVTDSKIQKSAMANPKFKSGNEFVLSAMRAMDLSADDLGATKIGSGKMMGGDMMRMQKMHQRKHHRRMLGLFAQVAQLPLLYPPANGLPRNLRRLDE